MRGCQDHATYPGIQTYPHHAGPSRDEVRGILFSLELPYKALDLESTTRSPKTMSTLGKDRLLGLGPKDQLVLNPKPPKPYTLNPQTPKPLNPKP